MPILDPALVCDIYKCLMCNLDKSHDNIKFLTQNPDVKYKDGDTPLILAIKNKNSKLVQLLLYRGATIPEEEEDVEEVGKGST